MRIRDKVFLVTGAASGLGAGAVHELIDRGGRVVMADIDADGGKELADRLGANARFIRTDVGSAADGAAAVKLAIDEFGGLHGLVNSAGVATSERALSKGGPHSLETFQKAINVNLVGTFNMIRLAAEAIAAMPPDDEGERGVIVNMASIAAFDGQIGQAAYAASKGGVASMTLPLARDLARNGIRVMAIAPGIFETPMLAGLPAEIVAELAASIPFPQRAGRPEDFAALVVHILENPMLNGEVIHIDGALRMGTK
jgi:NAD(P)-dependent dehydrogenase (short-subunit alcohol dehydrogenase family)